MKHIKLFENSEKIKESTFSKVINILSLKMGEHILNIMSQGDEDCEIYNWFIWSEDNSEEIYESQPFGTHINFDQKFFDRDINTHDGFFPDRYDETTKSWTIIWEVRYKFKNIDKNILKKLKDKNLGIPDEYPDDYNNGCTVFMIEYPISDFFEKNYQMFKDINT